MAPGEVEWWEKNNDPIDRYETFLLAQRVATKDKLEAIVADVMREIDDDCAWAESSPMPNGLLTTFSITAWCRRHFGRKFWKVN